MPTQVTLDDVNKEKDFANVESVVDVAYDEAGSRLWYSVDNRVRNEKWTEVTLPGIGVFRSENADAANPTYELVRQDLVAGAYRDASGNVHFPVLDAQGSVRGYVTKSGLESAYDYYPYGTVVEVSPNGGDDNRRWQDKEFDNEHHKYYFGARYYDPFFGMWMSPDPAGQFANPYSYGGDPVNFVDPNGEEAISTGAVIGIAAAIGAIIGGATSAYQCSKYGAGSCSVAVTQGITVGAASGAAGGAAGFAAGGGGAIASGIAGGAAGSATSYVGNGLYTGDMSFGEGFRQTMIGGFSGAIGGGVSYGVGTSGVNILGNTSAEILGSAVAGGFGTLANGGNFWDGFGNGALLGLSSALLSSTANILVDEGDYDGVISENGSQFREGDIVVMGRDGSPESATISWLSGEDYTHTAYVDKDVNTGKLFFREATSAGEEIYTELNTYNNRRYKVIGNKLASRPYVKRNNGWGILGRNDYGSDFWNGYNLVETNCTSQATRWTGLRYTNNPGVLARYMGAVAPRYYNGLSLQRFAW